MPTPLNILIVEDSAEDAALLVYELRKAGYDPQWERVENESDYSASLGPHVDVIFSDFSLPGFSAQRALQLFQQSRLDIPFIIVSGVIGEELAVESLRAGATDYVLKDHLSRLVPVVQRALREKRDRADRQKLESELAARDEQLTSFFSNAAAGLSILDRDLRFVRINQTLAQINGLPAEAHIGKTVREVLPDMAPELEPLLHNVLATSQPILNLEISGETRAEPGVVRHWVASDFPLLGDDGKPDGVGCVVVEVTERKRAEESLRASEEKFRLIAETIDEVFWATDVDKNTLLYVSPAYERIWGRSTQSLYENPRSFIEAVHVDDREHVLAALETQKQGQPHALEYRVVRPDGSVRWIWSRGFPVRAATGAVTQFIGLAEDVTERKHLEEQLRHAQKMESIGQLAGGIAHDFNNLLMLILGHAQLLTMEPRLSSKAKECAQQITLAGERAAGLTRQLLTFSRRQVIQSRLLDLNAVIEGVARMLRRVMGEDLAVEVAPGKLPLILADAGMLEQVLVNLAVNARDAMQAGGTFRILTGVEYIKDAAEQNPDAGAGDYVWLKVSDTGSGISGENMSKIFEPFFTTKDVGKGTGLGLATVYGIVRQHRGWIVVDSKVNEGTTFKIYLPATRTQTSSNRPVAADERIHGGSETVLVVEDEAPLRQMVRTLLESRGYHVLEAGSGRSALDEWGNDAGRIDLLVTDLVMPGGVSGRDLADKLKTQNPNMKIIFMSGYSVEVAGKDFELNDGMRFLQKPYVLHSLAKCVRESLDSSP